MKLAVINKIITISSLRPLINDTYLTGCTSQIWQEGNMFVSYNPELEVASCGKTLEKAGENLKEAFELFIEATKKTGVLKDI